MARALHLLHGDRAALAGDVIARQLAAGDEVTVVLLDAAPAPILPAGAAVRRVSTGLPWREVLELIFAADHVTAW